MLLIATPSCVLPDSENDVDAATVLVNRGREGMRVPIDAVEVVAGKREMVESDVAVGDDPERGSRHCVARDRDVLRHRLDGRGAVHLYARFEPVTRNHVVRDGDVGVRDRATEPRPRFGLELDTGILDQATRRRVAVDRDVRGPFNFDHASIDVDERVVRDVPAVDCENTIASA